MNSDNTNRKHGRKDIVPPPQGIRQSRPNNHVPPQTTNRPAGSPAPRVWAIAPRTNRERSLSCELHFPPEPVDDTQTRRTGPYVLKSESNVAHMPGWNDTPRKDEVRKFVESNRTSKFKSELKATAVEFLNRREAKRQQDIPSKLKSNAVNLLTKRNTKMNRDSPSSSIDRDLSMEKRKKDWLKKEQSSSSTTSKKKSVTLVLPTKREDKQKKLRFPDDRQSSPTENKLSKDKKTNQKSQQQQSNDNENKKKTKNSKVGKFLTRVLKGVFNSKRRTVENGPSAI